MKTTSCCGAVLYKRKKAENVIIPNPKVINGVKVIYLGQGYLKLRGKASGLTYHASDHQRQFTVEEDDVTSILRYSHVILKP